MNRSLHRRLTAVVGLGVAAVLVVGAVAVVSVLERVRRIEFDAASHQRLRALSQLVEQDQGRVEFEWDEAGAGVQSLLAEGETVTAWIDGRVASVLPHSATPVPPAPHAADGVAVLAFQPRSDDCTAKLNEVVLTVARPTGARDATTDRLRWLALLIVLLGVAVTLPVVWWGVGRGLQPLGRAAAAIAALDADTLERRVGGAGDVPTELRPLLDRIDDLLARLQRAFARERGFSADLAHELRTPLAGLQTQIEVAVGRPRPAAAYRAVLERCGRMVAETTATVEALLVTASGHGAAVAGVPLVADLRPLLHRVADERSLAAGSRGLAWDWRLPAAIPVAVPESTLHLLVRNLLDNAVSHADASTTVIVAAEVGDDAVTLHVDNAAGSFDPADAAHVFERFWRGDRSRSATGRHSGLGLPLCRRLVATVGGSLEVVVAHGRFQVRLGLPRREDGADRAEAE